MIGLELSLLESSNNCYSYSKFQLKPETITEKIARVNKKYGDKLSKYL